MVQTGKVDPLVKLIITHKEKYKRSKWYKFLVCQGTNKSNTIYTLNMNCNHNLEEYLMIIPE